MKLLVMAGVLAACAMVVSAAPVLGDDEGTVAAQVTVAAPCIEVTPAQLDFGTLGLSASSDSPVGASRQLTATNCGAAASLLGRGTNATSPGGTTWTLVEGSLCAAPNRYQEIVQMGQETTSLSTENATLRALAASEATALNAIVFMPCAGSGGAGEVMTFSYVFTAVLG
jgi:hypothetical protein